MVDRAKILAQIDLDRGRGLEIGAQTRPVVTRDMGRIEYVDRCSTEELRRWYGNDPAIDATSLVEVDHVWGEKTLLDCVGGLRAFDYVVASHVLEHVPDLLGWLEEIAEVLVDGGIASFVVPDRRFTFDILRQPTGKAELVDAYLRKLRRPAPRQIFDHFHHHRDISAPGIRDGSVDPATLPPLHTPVELMQICRHAHENSTYIDAHCWVFTPRTFVATLDFANELGLLPFEIAAVIPTPPNSDEFFVSLRRLPCETAAGHREAFLASRASLDLPAEDRSADLGDLMQRLAQARREIDSLRGSTSWRVTAPLRRAISFLRRMRRGTSA
ncbi:MAG: class I SAM-dependent methyltransferase [Alphaproteobacteria bacterium]|nr:class I SAM-dependent methyltransferase [Alphaproteobacteria bacterium]